MTRELKQWVKQQTEALGAATLHRAPNMLPDEKDVIAFLVMLADNIGSAREVQLSAVQFWALTDVGHDARSAYDWLIILRVLKEEIGERLTRDFEATTALAYWRELDDVLTYAIIEATQLSSDVNRAALLEHMVDLQRQMDHFERSKSNFIIVAAHELKTPLTILEGYANMLLAETDPEVRIRIYIDGLKNGIRRMHAIIADLIDVSLIDLQSFELKYQHFYLEKIILGVADNLDRFYFERHVDLVIMPFELRQKIYGDPEKLAKAFMKVLLNALKFTPDNGRVTITSELTRQDEVTEEIDGYIDVQITDTGIGINSEDFDQIFNKFTSAMDVTLHSTGQTKFKGGGAGLGLPIAKGIVEAHGGQIWVESPGCDEVICPGSTFHVVLPIRRKMPEVSDGKG